MVRNSQVADVIEDAGGTVDLKTIAFQTSCLVFSW